MRKLLVLLALIAATVASAQTPSHRTVSFFGPAVTNVSVRASCTNGVGQTGTTFAYTQTSTNNLLYYTGDGIAHQVLSSTNFVFVGTNAGLAYFTNTVVNTNVLNGYPWGVAMTEPKADGDFLPTSLSITVCGTNSGMTGTASFVFEGSQNKKYWQGSSTNVLFNPQVILSGTTPSTLITNFPSTFSTIKYWRLQSVTVTTNTGGYLQIPDMSLNYFAP